MPCPGGNWHCGAGAVHEPVHRILPSLCFSCILLHLSISPFSAQNCSYQVEERKEKSIFWNAIYNFRKAFIRVSLVINESILSTGLNFIDQILIYSFAHLKWELGGGLLQLENHPSDLVESLLNVTSSRSVLAEIKNEIANYYSWDSVHVKNCVISKFILFNLQ